MDTPFGACGTHTLFAGLKYDNLIALWGIKGAMDGEAFVAYIRDVLAPELRLGTVVICEKLATHYNERLWRSCETSGVGSLTCRHTRLSTFIIRFSNKLAPYIAYSIFA